MSQSCYYKREKNPKPILPLCSDNLKCVHFDFLHRSTFYHTTFEKNQKDRLHFLLKASRYGLKMKKKKHTLSRIYLWEQFSCDLHRETYYNFLLYCYQYVMSMDKQLQKNSLSDEDKNELYLDLMIVIQSFFTLEENAITGIFYLNRGFIMWLFKLLKKEELLEFLKKEIESRRGIIYDIYGIHFENLLKLIRQHSIALNQSVHSLLGRMDAKMLLDIYLDFMNTENYTIFAEQKAIVPVERSIYQYQKQFKHIYVEPLTISNTGIVAICNLILEREGIDKINIKTGFLS